MNLYILRHGIAVEPGTPGYASDADRPLTPKGKRKLRKIARALKAMKISFDWILSSPYLRARQTADIVATVLGCQRRLEFTDHLGPSGVPAKLIEQLNRPLQPEHSSRRAAKSAQLENVLLVGHEPYLSALVSLLMSGGTQAGIVLKKGGLCKLSAEALKPGRCAQLDWLLTPAQLADLR